VRYWSKILVLRLTRHDQTARLIDYITHP